MPGQGGVQPYLEHMFGEVFGFLAAWTWVVAVMPATLALLSMVFVETIFSAAGRPGEERRLTHKVLAIGVLAAVAAINSFGTRASTRLNNFFVCTKFTTILLVATAGLVVVVVQTTDPVGRDLGGWDWFEKPWFGYRDSRQPDGSVVHWEDLGTWGILGYYSTALYGALWSYSGWDKVGWHFPRPLGQTR